MSTRKAHSRANDLRRSLAALSLMSVAGCSLANFIADESIDYNSTVEAATNDMLVTNILRGRDEAPVFFSDLSQIRGSIQFNVAAQSTIPWGPQFRPSTGTGVRRSVQAGPIQLQNAPTFDIAPQNTKQFYQGVMEPLGKAVLANYLRSGIPKDVVLRLFVSSIDTVAVVGEKASLVAHCRYTKPCFDEFIKKWTFHDGEPEAYLPFPNVVIAAEPKKIGGPVGPNAKALIDASNAGLEVKALDDAGTRVQLLKASPHITFCVNDGNDRYTAVGVTDNSLIKTPEGGLPPKSDDECNLATSQATTPVHALRRTEPARPVLRYMMHLRSVKEVFYYLGDLIKDGKPRPNPLYLNISKSPPPKVRFAVEYRGDTYYVSELRHYDNTIRILSILNDLLNLNRDASATPTTKAVQAVGG